MKLAIRRIGNSLGIIIPQATLNAWGLGEGDSLDLTGRNIRPPSRGGLSHQALDELRLAIALKVVANFTPEQIRAKILANLHRWKAQGVWGGPYDEWRDLAERADNGALFAAMLGRDENAIRLRQSMPFVGLLSQDEIKKLHEEAAS